MNTKTLFVNKQFPYFGQLLRQQLIQQIDPQFAKNLTRNLIRNLKMEFINDIEWSNSQAIPKEERNMIIMLTGQSLTTKQISQALNRDNRTITKWIEICRNRPHERKEAYWKTTSNNK